MSRHLISLRRRLDAPRREAYGSLWDALHRAATERGAHAWRFAAADDPELRLEFLEFAADADPRAAPEVRDLLRRLDREVAAAEVEEWREAPAD